MGASPRPLRASWAPRFQPLLSLLLPLAINSPRRIIGRPPARTPRAPRRPQHGQRRPRAPRRPPPRTPRASSLTPSTMRSPRPTPCPRRCASGGPPPPPHPLSPRPGRRRQGKPPHDGPAGRRAHAGQPGTGSHARRRGTLGAYRRRALSAAGMIRTRHAVDPHLRQVWQDHGVRVRRCPRPGRGDRRRHRRRDQVPRVRRRPQAKAHVQVRPSHVVPHDDRQNRRMRLEGLAQARPRSRRAGPVQVRNVRRGRPDRVTAVYGMRPPPPPRRASCPPVL